MSATGTNNRHRPFLARPKIEVSATSSRFERIEHGKKVLKQLSVLKKKTGVTGNGCEQIFAIFRLKCSPLQIILLAGFTCHC